MKLRGKQFFYVFKKTKQCHIPADLNPELHCCDISYLTNKFFLCKTFSALSGFCKNELICCSSYMHKPGTVYTITARGLPNIPSINSFVFKRNI